MLSQFLLESEQLGLLDEIGLELEEGVGETAQFGGGERERLFGGGERLEVERVGGQGFYGGDYARPKRNNGNYGVYKGFNYVNFI
jgi:hypothetical protein